MYKAFRHTPVQEGSTPTFCGHVRKPSAIFAGRLPVFCAVVKIQLIFHRLLRTRGSNPPFFYPFLTIPCRLLGRGVTLITPK